MKIALFSYEYPPETGRGGIATCTYQTAQMMAGRGHQVEVFAGSYSRSQSGTEDGIVVHRALHQDHETFHDAVAPIFLERHASVGFDLLESPELLAEARSVADQAPDVARVVKIHSPNALLFESTHGRYQPPALLERIHLHLDAIRMGEKPYWAGAGQAAPATDHIAAINKTERLFVEQADAIIIPSKHMKSKLVDHWQIDPSGLLHVPNVFCPSPAILDIPIDIRTNRITYIGRLEPLKGVFDLARAIPIIRRRHPAVRFRIIGESQQSDIFGDLRSYLLRTLLRRQLDHVDVVEAVPTDQIIRALSETDICVFPSILDNFPYACLEAMAAGRGVVGTLGTGMAEMMQDNVSGKLVPMFAPLAIADAITFWLKRPDLRQAVGVAARQRVAEAYSQDTLGPMQEQAYIHALKRRDQRAREAGLDA